MAAEAKQTGYGASREPTRTVAWRLEIRATRVWRAWRGLGALEPLSSYGCDPVWTINQIVAEYCGGVYPDLLTIDLEGLDLAVLASADFSKSHPQVVVAEIGRDRAAEARAVMGKWGYCVLCRMISNLIFVHEDWIEDVR